MGVCRSCQEKLDDKDLFCPYCGYDSKTDMVSPSFKPEAAKQKKQKKPVYGGSGIDPRIKKFAWAGIALLFFSILYKYNFNVGLVFEEAKSFVIIKAGRIFQGPTDKKNPAKKEPARSVPAKTQSAPGDRQEAVVLEWSDVKDYQATGAVASNSLLLEGIFFDPAAKSFATINGQVVSEGEAVLGVTVTKIEQYSVELAVDGKRQVLAVNQRMPLPKND